MLYPHSNLTSIAIVSGEPLVGHALEQMLRSDGYDARLLDQSSVNGPSTIFEGASLVLLAPRMSGADREALFELLRNGVSEKVAAPVLELVSGSDEAQDKEEVGARRVLWPCQLKVLKREIEAALSNGS
ncbi:MAG: hypothetical protein M3305_06750 [Actinomycetota bacterium]|nr:hypothetical protein [Actinomycetota bacterium]